MSLDDPSLVATAELTFHGMSRIENKWTELRKRLLKFVRHQEQWENDTEYRMTKQALGCTPWTSTPGQFPMNWYVDTTDKSGRSQMLRLDVEERR